MTWSTSHWKRLPLIIIFMKFFCQIFPIRKCQKNPNEITHSSMRNAKIQVKRYSTHLSYHNTLKTQIFNTYLIIWYWHPYPSGFRLPLTTPCVVFPQIERTYFTGWCTSAFRNVAPYFFNVIYVYFWRFLELNLRPWCRSWRTQPTHNGGYSYSLNLRQT